MSETTRENRPKEEEAALSGATGQPEAEPAPAEAPGGPNAEKSALQKRRRRRRPAQSSQPVPEPAAGPTPEAPADDIKEKGEEPAPEKAKPAPKASTKKTKDPSAPQSAPEVPAREEKAPKAPPEDKPQREGSPKSAEKPAPEAAPAPEKPGPAPQEASAPQPDDGEETDGKMPGGPTEEELEARAAEMTRTVQLSLQQVLESLPDVDLAMQGPTESALLEEGSEPEPQISLGRRVIRSITGGAFSLFKWLCLVAALVAVIAGLELAWLYHSADEEMIPALTVTFDGQQLSSAAYTWKVPVVGKIFHRTYAQTVTTEPQKLDTVANSSPVCQVTPTGYDTQLTVLDSESAEVFYGSVEDFRRFSFTEDGVYSAQLVISKTSASTASVTGSQTYLFEIPVSLRPTVRLSARTAMPGSVIAIRVSASLTQSAPTLKTKYLPEQDDPTGETSLGAVQFVPGASGWVGYLPIAYDQQQGSYELTVTANGYEQTFTLAVAERDWDYQDYTSNSQLITPYLGEEDTPDEVRAVLRSSSEEIAWKDTGFVQPFVSAIQVKLAYGTTEYVGRTTTQRMYNTGTGRGATNTVITVAGGSDLISPAAGTVVLAQELEGTAGNTVVIDHGAGLKSIFYGMRSISVEKGDTVIQGETLGETGSTMICEVRIGTVPVDPLAVWRGQCDAIKLN